jgi:predicted nucleic acid-binding protein
MVLIDSSVFINFFNDVSEPQVDTFALLVKRGQVLSGDLVVSEVLQGFRSDKDFLLAKRLLSSFTNVSLVNRSLAIKSAVNYRFLRSHGFTVRKSIDCLIATWCIENNIPLLHSDRDFAPFEKHLGLVTL